LVAWATPSLDSHIEVSDFAQALAAAVLGQLNEVHGRDEFVIESIVRKYWDPVGGGFERFEVAGSAVFVPFCVLKARATSGEFKVSATHSVFVNDAINHPGRAYFRVPLSQHAPRGGDNIQNNRTAAHHDFEFAKTHTPYESYLAIVVERGVDYLGKFVRTAGGNEGDLVRRKRVPLNPHGTVNKAKGCFICVLNRQK
jgi:hypothetical protein